MVDRTRRLDFGTLLLVLGISGCAPLSDPSSADREFRLLEDDFVTTHFSARPVDGVGLGWHQFDGQFVVPDAASLAAEDARLHRFQKAFGGCQPERLSPHDAQDLLLLRSVIDNQLWALEVQRSPERNPMFYAGALDVSVYLKRDFKPLDQRIRDISAILRTAPRVFVAARHNLEPILPKPFVQTAIEVALGTARFIQDDVTAAANTVRDPQIRSDFRDAAGLAEAELNGFADWLKQEKLPRADDSFALGNEGYRKMLQAERVDLTPEEILAIGQRELKAEQERFARAAAVIDPGEKPVNVFKEIQREHPRAAQLISDTRQDLEGIRRFVVSHRIVTIPSAVPAEVTETLPPFRSTSFASMDTPGPFEHKATQAYYYVTPVETNWPPEQAEQWLTAFNNYTTDIVSIHEVYPGHYVQFLVLNASPASTAEKVFASYPFVEGWAHYSEQMMIEQGFGQPGPGSVPSHQDLVRAAKFRLAQSDEALLRLCRLCVSIKLHTQGMSVEDATRFFMENCYYEEKPAHDEAMRGTFDPGYLYYSLGKLMILKLRHDWEVQEGARFSLERFHDAFLSHGAPPIPLLRQIMISDPKVRLEIL